MFPYTDNENKLQIKTWLYCAPLSLLLYEDGQRSSTAVASAAGLLEAALSQPAACCQGQTAAVPFYSRLSVAYCPLLSLNLYFICENNSKMSMKP